MKIILNGVQQELKGTISLTELLVDRGFADKVVAVAINGSFVPKSNHTQQHISEGDQIEIVAPMQGG